MTPKVFDTLTLLVENAGKTVAKEEFLNRVWPDTVVEEANLTRSIFLLRKLLGEKESGRKMILTRSSVGYMFVPRVSRCGTVETYNPQMNRRGPKRCPDYLLRRSRTPLGMAEYKDLPRKSRREPSHAQVGTQCAAGH